MDTPLATLAISGKAVPLHDASVLIVESNPTFYESLPRTLRSAMPEIVFDVCSSRDDGLSRLEKGSYHAVISDARLAEAADYSVLKRAQSLSCPVPVLLSEKTGDSQAVSRALARGALDMIRCSLSGVAASEVIRRALWLYQLRQTIHHRRQRLETLRSEHITYTRTVPMQTMMLVERTMKNIEEAEHLCERTIQQIESSIRVLQEICDHFEADARECALRVARLL
jgi:DNA-binding NtrC family response regulator